MSSARFLLPLRARSCTLRPEVVIRTLVVSLIGVAAVTAGLVLFRQQKLVDTRIKELPAGETVPRSISLERLRELGL